MNDPFYSDPVVIEAGEQFAKAQAERRQSPALEMLNELCTEEDIERMEKMITESTYVIPKMIPTGSLAVIVAHPNGAKTLSTLALIRNEIREGRLDGRDVFYINEDDNLAGLLEKRKHFLPMGVKMISSIHSAVEGVNNTTDVMNLILQVAEDECAAGKVFIFDTYKKFTSPMNSGMNVEFHKNLRRISSMGGTVILLHHANKHKDDDGKIVIKGTQDIMDDVDIVYHLNPQSEKDAEQQIVEYRAEKDRGYIEPVFRYQYRKATDLTYVDMLDSFGPVDDEEWSRLAAVEISDKFLASIADDRETVRQMLGGKTMSGAELEKYRRDEHVELSKNRLERLLPIMATVGLLKRSEGSHNSKRYTFNNDWKLSDYNWFQLPQAWR